jgi:hypothetical protein
MEDPEPFDKRVTFNLYVYTAFPLTPEHNEKCTSKEKTETNHKELLHMKFYHTKGVL